MHLAFRAIDKELVGRRDIATGARMLPPWLNEQANCIFDSSMSSENSSRNEFTNTGHRRREISLQFTCLKTWWRLIVRRSSFPESGRKYQFEMCITGCKECAHGEEMERSARSSRAKSRLWRMATPLLGAGSRLSKWEWK